MIVYKDTWHYKMIDQYTPFSLARSLCGYFWQIIGSVFFIVQVVPLLGIAVIAGPFLVFYGPFNPWVHDLPVYFSIFLMIASIIGVMAWSMAILVGLWKLMDKGMDMAISGSSGFFAERSEGPGIFSQWLKAKKDKVCPIIEYKDRE